MRLIGEWRRCESGAPGCNWLISPNNPDTRCRSCRLTTEFPTDNGSSTQQWSIIESSKRRLLYSLLALNLPVDALRFVFTSKTMTGHAHGVISINLAEADDVERERRRVDLQEPYRTLVGHFRHESGHYYWDVLLKSNPAQLDQVRALFGDDTQDYSAALKLYYTQGAPEDWATHHVSAYATAHPWEDWAETWAHYLHMCDAVEIAAAYRLSFAAKQSPSQSPSQSQSMPQAFADHGPAQPSANEHPHSQLTDTTSLSFDDLLTAWLPLTYFANSLNRSIGLRDWYPFILSDGIIAKLRLIHHIVNDRPAGNGIK